MSGTGHRLARQNGRIGRRRPEIDRTLPDLVPADEFEPFVITAPVHAAVRFVVVVPPSVDVMIPPPVDPGVAHKRVFAAVVVRTKGRRAPVFSRRFREIDHRNRRIQQIDPVLVAPVRLRQRKIHRRRIIKGNLLFEGFEHFPLLRVDQLHLQRKLRGPSRFAVPELQLRRTLRRQHPDAQHLVGCHLGRMRLTVDAKLVKAHHSVRNLPVKEHPDRRSLHRRESITADRQLVVADLAHRLPTVTAPDLDVKIHGNVGVAPEMERHIVDLLLFRERHLQPVVPFLIQTQPAARLLLTVPVRRLVRRERQIVTVRREFHPRLQTQVHRLLRGGNHPPRQQQRQQRKMTLP